MRLDIVKFVEFKVFNSYNMINAYRQFVVISEITKWTKNKNLLYSKMSKVNILTIGETVSLDKKRCITNTQIQFREGGCN